MKTDETKSDKKKKETTLSEIIGIVFVILMIWFFWSVFFPGNPSTSIPSVTNTTSAPITISPRMSDTNKLKALVTNALIQSALGKNSSVRSIDVVKQTLATPPGGYGVFVEFNAGENFTANMTKQGIDMQMTDVYKALYTSNIYVRTASIAAYLPLTDKYGNTSTGMVYKTILNRSVAKKVNWGVDKSVLGLQILPGLWTTTILNPSLKS